LRDDVTRALNLDLVTDADVETINLLFIVQSGVRDDDTAHGDGSQARDRGERPSPSDLNVDGFQGRDRLLSRKLVRNRPTRGAADKAQPLLPVEAVHFVDDAINVIAERGATLDHVAIGVEQTVDTVMSLEQVIDLEPPLPQRFDSVCLRVGKGRRVFTPGIGEEFKRPLSGHGRVLLTQAARGCIARVHVSLAPGRVLGGIQGREIFGIDIDLAAHFDPLWPAAACERLWNVFQRARISSDVFPDPAVASRGGLLQDAVQIGQAERQSIDLWFGRNYDRFFFREPEKTSNAIRKILHVFIAERVVE